MKCENCEKRLPLIFGRDKRIKAKLSNKIGIVECEFCGKECLFEYAKKWGAKIIS